MLRQLHPDPSFIQAFRSPLQLSPGVSIAASHRMRCAVVLHMHSEHKARLFFASFGCHLAGVADFLLLHHPLLSALHLNLSLETME